MEEDRYQAVKVTSAKEKEAFKPVYMEWFIRWFSAHIVSASIVNARQN